MRSFHRPCRHALQGADFCFTGVLYISTFLSHAVATMIHGCISLSSWCLLMVVCLFLAVPWGCLLFVIVVFPDHAHILFLGSEYPLNLLYMNHKTGDLETWFASLDSK